MSVLATQRSGNKMIHAEGEAQAAEKLARRHILSVFILQTLTEVSAEKNSTTILPSPIDLMTALFQKGGEGTN